MHQQGSITFILLIILFIGVISVAAARNVGLSDLQVDPRHSTENRPLSTFPTDLPTVDAPMFLYRIKLTNKRSDLAPWEYYVQTEVESVLGIPIKGITYDARETKQTGKPADDVKKFDASYYILVEGKEIERRSYENESLIVKVSSADQKLMPYIKDNDYCQVDADCTVRWRFCLYGSYNYYQPFIEPWGCGGVYDAEREEYSDKSGLQPYSIHVYDEKMACRRDVKYTESRCIDNKCIGQGRVVSCLKD